MKGRKLFRRGCRRAEPLGGNELLPSIRADLTRHPEVLAAVATLLGEEPVVAWALLLNKTFNKATNASLAAVAPVLELPISAHFSWVRKRLNQLDGLLSENFPDSRVAGEMHETFTAYVHAR